MSIGFIVSWTYLRFFKTGANERQLYILPFALTHKRKNRFNTTTTTTTTVNNSNTSHISVLIQQATITVIIPILGFP